MKGIADAGLRCCAGVALALGLMLAAGAARGANCAAVSTGNVPLVDLGTALYLGQYDGGLYPDGNEPPSDHRAAGLARANAVTPRNAAGAPAADGKVVLISIGMSNTEMEWCSFTGTACTSWSFTGQALADPDVDHERLVIANGAKNGEVAIDWLDPDGANFVRIRDEVLPAAGVTPAQVQVAWVKLVDAGPSLSLPHASADAFLLQGYLGTVMRSLRENYPNLAIVFLSSRIYAGYATSALNPEPYAYESGFAVKWLIEGQIRQMRGEGVDALSGDLDYTTGVAPWLAWGAYLWADGTTPRSDGLVWNCSDFVRDGTHPSQPTGRMKVGTQLLDFLLESEFSTPWFRVPEPAGALLEASSGAALLALARARRGRRAASPQEGAGPPVLGV